MILLILHLFQSCLIVVLFSCQYLGLFLNRADHKFLDLKRRNSVPGYGPEYTHPGNDP